MFDSTHAILNQYIDTEKVSRFTFYSVEMERGENLEDLYYLCTIRNGYYVVFETDYILNTLTEVAQEAAEIFAKYNLAPLHWIVKKDSQTAIGTPILPITANVDKLHDSLIFDKTDSPFSYNLRYAVMEFTSIDSHKEHRFHPGVYGYAIN